MPVSVRTQKGKCKAKIEGDMTIYTALEIKEKLVKQMGKCQSMELEMSQILEFDTAGFQILGLLKREAERLAIDLQFKNHSTTVQDVLILYHVTEQLDQIFASYDHEDTNPGGQAL